MTRELSELWGELLTTHTEEILPYGSLFRSADGKEMIVTNDGKSLYQRHPEFVGSCLRKDPEYLMTRVQFAQGINSVIYKIKCGEEVFAEKEYKSLREDGISQLKRLMEIDEITRRLQRVRIPALYFATPQTLVMEFVDAPTWDDVVGGPVNPDKVKDNELMRSFDESGGLEALVGKANIKHDCILVKQNESGEHEFIIIDQ